MSESSFFSATPELIAELGFDPDALLEKYRYERDKRVRTDGVDQYVEASGDFSHYVDDPHVEPGFSRPAFVEEVEVVVIGAGFAGLSAAAHLRMAGIENIRIIEKAGDFGGTWYWSRYPGVRCDIESYVYIPLLEETGFMPSQKYASGAEIFQQAQKIGQTFDLYKDAYFQTQVSEIRWLEAESRWLISTDREDEIKARFVIKTNAPLDRPKLPGIKGINLFKGRTFHTSRWDYHYTGGDTNGNLHKLGDQRIAVIGTGATAIQCVPYLGEYAEQVYVFQRTPSSVYKRNNAPTDPAWVKSLKPGWQAERRDNFVRITTGEHLDVDLVDDGWTQTVRALGGFFSEADPNMSLEETDRLAQIADFKRMNEIRAHIEEVVEDPATAEALKPWYRQFCKRPCFSDEYLQSFNLPNVTLVDTQGSGVDEITENGLIANGIEYPVDCIIFATGFEVGTGWARRSGCDIIGRGGALLADEWRHGMKTLHGFYTHGFPNLFHMGITQNGASYAYTYGTEEQAKHIAALLKRAEEDKIEVIEPTPEAEADWVSTIRRLSAGTLAYFRECTPGYYNGEGSGDDSKGFFGEAYGGGPIECVEILRKWRSGPLEGLMQGSAEAK